VLFPYHQLAQPDLILRKARHAVAHA